MRSRIRRIVLAAAAARAASKGEGEGEGEGRARDPESGRFLPRDGDRVKPVEN